MILASFLVDKVGLWAEVRRPALRKPVPILLLDRDGVIIDDTGYFGKTEQVRMFEGIGAAIGACNRREVPGAVVTNQSGIARGYYDWADFAGVQRTIDHAIAADGGHIDAVFACAYHEQGRPDLAIANHPWRKPRPGMLNAALDLLNGDRNASAMLGDKDLDLEAASTAGVWFKALVGEHPAGTMDGRADPWGAGVGVPAAIHAFLEAIGLRSTTRTP